MSEIENNRKLKMPKKQINLDNEISNKNISDKSTSEDSKLYTSIPSFIFRDRSVAVLESLVEYLKDRKKLSFHEIAILLNRDDRTIWTVYNRVKLKRHKRT